MKEISYKTAVLAKEKGYFTEEPFKFRISGKRFETGKPLEWMPHIENKPDYFSSDRVFMPKQAELQEWLRENHDIDVYPIRSFSMVKSYHYELIVKNDYDNAKMQEVKKDRSYEQCFEEGLYQALILLK